MNKKKTVILILWIIIVIFLILISKNLKHKNNSKNINSNNIEEKVTTDYSYDETNSIYTIYDKNTNKILQTTEDEAAIKMYLENPDFNPDLPEIENE